MNLSSKLGRRGVVGVLGWAGLTAVLLWPGLGQAQEKKKAGQASRSVRGVVHAPDGSPQAGAVVQLENKRTMQVRSFLSQADGTYYFRDLNADVDYELRAELPARGEASDKHTLSTFDSRKDVTIDLQLKAGK